MHKANVGIIVCSQGAAAYPENEDQQQRLREAAEGLRVATNAAAQNAIKKKLINRLEVSRGRSPVTLWQEKKKIQRWGYSRKH